jgi:hypothetical protein
VVSPTLWPAARPGGTAASAATLHAREAQPAAARSSRARAQAARQRRWCTAALFQTAEASGGAPSRGRHRTAHTPDAQAPAPRARVLLFGQTTNPNRA